MPPLPKGRGTTLVVEGYVIVLIYVLQPANTTKKTAITAVLNIIICPLSCGNMSSFRRQAPKDD